jgi:DNA-binding transcriptional MerR regulator
MSDSATTSVDAAATGHRAVGKSASAFRTISEVAGELDVPQHVLRFWESKFSQVKPLKRGGGRRYYRPEDIELLRTIRALLYRDGYTIKGVQKLLREGAVPPDAAEIPVLAPKSAGNSHSAAASSGPGAAGLSAGQRREIEAVIDELTALKSLLQG